MSFIHPRLRRELDTAAVMIGLYCKKHHTARALCPECRELLEYARLRLGKCPFQEKKPTCAKCTVHCYNLSMREKIRAVMRYSGPRMMLRHPLLAVMHLIDGRKSPPSLSPVSNRQA